MRRETWTPMLEDWTVDPAELARPANVAPAMWEVNLYRGNRGERDTSMAALFGAMSTFSAHRFVLTIGTFEHFADWQQWAVRQVAGLSGYVGQLFLHWAQRASEHDVFRTDTDAIVRRAWPLPNVTIATAPITTQAEADRVLPALLAVKAARREAVFAPREEIDIESCFLTGEYAPRDFGGAMNEEDGPKPDAVRVRGGDAPMHPAWVRGLRDQAQATGVPFSLTWGEWMPEDAVRGVVPLGTEKLCKHGTLFYRVGAARSGCTLDGVDYPEENL